MLTPERTMQVMCAQKAERMWPDLTPNEQAGVRLGLFPAARMQAADTEGYDPRLLAVALMGQARKDGGMVA